MSGQASHLDVSDKSKGFTPHGEVAKKNPTKCATGVAGEIDSPHTNHRFRSPAPALARLRWWRRPFCQGPCTLGPSFSGLCARCTRRG